jgi:translation elongation factor EF-4
MRSLASFLPTASLVFLLFFTFLPVDAQVSFEQTRDTINQLQLSDASIPGVSQPKGLI